MLPLLLIACTQPIDTDDPLVRHDPERMLTFAILTDPHITSEGEHADRLRAAVAWLADEPEVEVVLVLGDNAWGSGIELFPSLMEPLPVPWVPITGDNEIEAGDEEPAQIMREAQYAVLAGQLDHWSQAPAPVHNPELDGESWFSDVSFDMGGVHIALVDWCVRTETGILAEFGDLHDFDGGSLPWLEEDLAARTAQPWVLGAHIPTHVGLFDLDELERLRKGLDADLPDLLGIFAGHVHLDSEVPVDELDTTTYTVDATWDDVVALRMVEVWTDGVDTWMEQQKVQVPWP